MKVLFGGKVTYTVLKMLGQQHNPHSCPAASPFPVPHLSSGGELLEKILDKILIHFG